MDQGFKVRLYDAGGAPRGEAFQARFDRSWRLLSDHVELHDPALADRSEPAMAAGAAGELMVVWASQRIAALPFQPPVGNDGDSSGIFGQRLGNPRCAAGSEVLCLGPGGRFEVRVSWKTFTGETGVGRSVPLTGDTGALWFFQPDNLELMIKVLDGRLLNGHFWIFYGALSNVEYTITVTDTVTQKQKTYRNPAGQFLSRSDITAFTDDGKSVARATPAVATPPAVTTAAKAGCAASEESLCLAAGRFQVEVDFTDPNTGLAGRGRVLPLTADTGAFWFFGPENLELMIKVLDARPLNGKFWVFFGALSDVAYTITVTDTETNQQRTYRNEHGRLASRADLAAF